MVQLQRTETHKSADIRHNSEIRWRLCMEYKKIAASEIESLWGLQKQYKTEICEDASDSSARKRLLKAIAEDRICFYGE